MALSERLALLVSLDAGSAIKGLENIGKAADRNLSKADSKLDKTAQTFQKVGVGMLASAGLIGTGLFKAGQSAADLEQAVGGTEAVFKSSSRTIEQFAKGAASNMGLSERAFREATTSIGGQLKGLGFDTDDAADKAVELTGVAADLAATYGGTTAEAVQALGAAFRGEADPAERFNLRLNQNTVNAKAVALGLAESTSQVDAQAKAQATLALITEQSADAQGQFARETDSAAGSMQIATAEFENAKASLGESIAPILADVAQAASAAAGGFSSLNEKTGGALSKIAAIGTVSLAAGGGLLFAAGKVIEMRSNLGGLIDKLKGAEGGLGRVGKAGLIAGGALAAFTIGKMIEGATEATIELDHLAASLNEVGVAADEGNKRLVAGLFAFGQLDDHVKALSETYVIAADRLVGVAEAAGVAGADLQELRDIVEAKRDSDVQGAVDQEVYAAEMAETVPAAEGLTTAIQDQTGAAEAAAEAYKGLIDAVIGFADADLSLRESIDKTDDSLYELAEAEKAAAAAGGENREANEALEDALFNTEGAMLSQADAAVATAEEYAALSGKTLSTADKQAILRASLQESANKLAAGSSLRANIDATIARLDVLAKDRTSNVNIRITEQKIALASSKDAALNPVFPKRAAGGPVAGGRTYLVGEQGPELLTMGASGFVTPNSALGGSSVTNISITTGADPQAVVEAIKRYEKTNTAGWRT